MIEFDATISRTDVNTRFHALRECRKKTLFSIHNLLILATFKRVLLNFKSFLFNLFVTYTKKREEIFFALRKIIYKKVAAVSRENKFLSEQQCFLQQNPLFIFTNNLATKVHNY